MAGAAPTGERQGSHANRKPLKGHASPEKLPTPRALALQCRIPQVGEKSDAGQGFLPGGETGKSKDRDKQRKLQLVKQTGAAKTEARENL